jgi:hypothetical protein
VAVSTVGTADRSKMQTLETIDAWYGKALKFSGRAHLDEYGSIAGC